MITWNPIVLEIESFPAHDPLNGCLFSKTGVFLCGFFYPELF